MYGYNKYVPLKPEEIFKRATEEEIFKIVIQDDIIQDKGAMYIAPYRDDNNPDCYFEEFNGKLLFVDFASPYPIKSMNCIDFIKACYNVTFKEALEIINKELNLGLGDNLGKAKEIIHEYGYVEEKNVKKVFKERVITYLPRQFNYKDKQFWNKYEITKENLIEDKVIPVEIYKSISRKGEPFTVRPLDICYAYTGFIDIEGNPIEGKVKIYRPHASKDAKWFTNCSQNEVGSIQNLPLKGKLLIITKSYKDCRVLRNLGFNCIWFQNEGMIPNKKILLHLSKRFKTIIIWFDNDSTGITNSKIVSDYINNITKLKKTSSLFLPPILLNENIKDPSDYFEKKGKESLLKFLKEKQII